MSYTLPVTGGQVHQLLSPSDPSLGVSAVAALRQRAGRYGHGALHRAALHGHAEVVKELLKARAELSRDDEGEVPSCMWSNCTAGPPTRTLPLGNPR